MTRASTLIAIACITFSTAAPALAAGGHGGMSHSGVTYHPSQGWTVGTPPSHVHDHRNGNDPGGGVTVSTGTPNPNLHPGHGGFHVNQSPSRWRGTGIVRDHRGSGHRR